MNQTQTKAGFIKFGLFTMFVYLVTSYFYLMPTGVPQISDFVLAFGIMIVFVGLFGANKFVLNQTHLLAIAFAAWAFAVNIIYYIFLGDTLLFLSSLYYIYNVAIFIFITLLFRYDPQTTLRTIYYAIVISAVVEIIYIQFFPNFENGRVQGSFHNPNQLAYWALFSSCILILLRSYSQLKWYDLIVFFGFALIQSLAVSKAGLIAFGILALALPFMRALSNTYRIAFFMIALTIGIFAIGHMSDLNRIATQIENVNNIIDRLDNIGKEADDTLQWRGYYRPIQHWHYIFIGAGEGAYERFDDTPQPVEIHSAILNVIFSYGILGTIIFFTFLYYLIKQSPSPFIIVLLVIILNGLTHQNMRFSHFWIVFGVAYGMRYTISQKQNYPDADPTQRIIQTQCVDKTFP